MGFDAFRPVPDGVEAASGHAGAQPGGSAARRPTSSLLRPAGAGYGLHRGAAFPALMT